MKRKILSLLLSFTLCLSLLPTAALAEDATAMPNYNGGSGTKDDPWLISSVGDLQTLATTINDGKAAEFDANAAAGGEGVAGNYYGYYFKQTTDLDLSDIVNWDPIGYSGSCYFAGHYDGGGYTISNATSTGKKDTDGFATAGIFGWVAFGSVKNLTVKNADFLAAGDNNMSYAGGVLAVAYSCTVENCSAYNSKIESQRNPNNSNFAGGITGIALRSSFEKCASVGNTIRHGSFGGGFIGSLDGGDSNFTNCYVANCIVTGDSDTGAMSTLSGGFLGASEDGDAILNSCFVYDCVAQPDENSKGKDYFAVFTPNTQYGEVVAKSYVYYYDANDATVNADGAESKTSEEFTDGTVANALGTAFAQGKRYPVFATDPADYSAVDAAIAKANALNKDNYKDFSAVEAAVNAVDRNKKIAEQDDVNEMAKTIEGAIADLQYKDADYTKVDAAIAKANALNKDSYQDFSVVEKAIADVVRDKNITEQAKVDAMAKAIEDAIAALVEKPSSSGGSSSGGSSSPSYSVTTPGKTENGTVTVTPKSASKGSTVTITVKPDSGYQLDDLTVTDKNGNELKLTDKGNGKYTFTMPDGKVDVKATFVKSEPEQPGKTTFVDVPEGIWYEDAAGFVARRGLMSGVGENLFGGNQSTTRAMLMTILARMDGQDVSGGATWYEKGMNWAKNNGVSDGTMPTANITREQLATMLYSYAKLRGIDTTQGGMAVREFSDYDSISPWAGQSMTWAVNAGILSGRGNNTLAPTAGATRAEMAVMLQQFVGLMEK